MPVVEPLRPVGEGAVVQRDGDVLRLAGFERDLGEALELVHRACDLGLRRGHVDLHGFGAGHIGGVGHGHRHLGGARTGLGHGRVVHVERGVGQAVAERIGDLLAEGVVVPVSDEHALAVIDMTLLARPVHGGRIVVHIVDDGLREFTGRGFVAEDHVGERRAAGLAQQPGLQDRLGAALPRQRDHGTVRQHDRHVRVRGGHGLKHLDLLGGDVQCGAVETFGLVGGGQAEEQQYDVGLLGGRHGLLGQCRVLRRVVQREAGGEVGRDAALLERVEEAGELGRVDQRGAGALVARRAGEFADDGDLGALGDRQGGVLVLEQHHRFDGGLAGDLVVGVHVVPVAVPAHGRAGLGDQVDHALGHLVQLGGGDAPVLACGHNLVVRVARRHLQVQTGVERGHTVADRAPVGHDDALEAPFAAQHVGEQPTVLRGEHAVDLVVRAHDGPWLGGFDDVFEGRQINLAHGARGDRGADAQTVGLLVVGGEVLQRGAHALGLHALDDADGGVAGQVRVLAPVFEAAAAERVALDVDAGAEDDGHLLLDAFLTHRLADAFDEFRVPRAGHAGRRREAGGGHVLLDIHRFGVLGLAQAVRTVGDGVVRQALGRHIAQAPRVGAAGQRGLLFKGQVVYGGIVAHRFRSFWFGPTYCRFAASSSITATVGHSSLELPTGR